LLLPRLRLPPPEIAHTLLQPTLCRNRRVWAGMIPLLKNINTWLLLKPPYVTCPLLPSLPLHLTA
jgi:hypothetical protein